MVEYWQQVHRPAEEYFAVRRRSGHTCIQERHLRKTIVHKNNKYKVLGSLHHHSMERFTKAKGNVECSTISL